MPSFVQRPSYCMASVSFSSLPTWSPLLRSAAAQFPIISTSHVRKTWTGHCYCFNVWRKQDLPCSPPSERLLPMWVCRLQAFLPFSRWRAFNLSSVCGASTLMRSPWSYRAPLRNIISDCKQDNIYADSLFRFKRTKKKKKKTWLCTFLISIPLSFGW